MIAMGLHSGASIRIESGVWLNYLPPQIKLTKESHRGFLFQIYKIIKSQLLFIIIYYYKWQTIISEEMYFRE